MPAERMPTKPLSGEELPKEGESPLEYLDRMARLDNEKEARNWMAEKGV